jgi:hypothetical protein
MAQNSSSRLSDTRLVVTGHDEKGREVIMKDSSNEAYSVRDGAYVNTLWSSNRLPAAIDGDGQKVCHPADGNKGSFF